MISSSSRVICRLAMIAWNGGFHWSRWASGTWLLANRTTSPPVMIQ